MVLFGAFELPHVLNVQVQQARVEVEHFIPGRNVAYRRDQATLGRTLSVTGQIRESTISGAYTRIEQIRRMNDDVGRTFDLGDGETEAFTGKLVDPAFTFNVDDWHNAKYWVDYSLNILEVA